MTAVGEQDRRRARWAARVLTTNGVVRGGTRWMGRHGLLPRAVWSHLPVDGDIVVELPEATPFSCRLPDTDGVARQLYWRGGKEHEDATMRAFAQYASSARVVLDVGANVGLYTLVACAASRSSLVVAFEPVGSSYAQLCRNLELNGWSGRVDARQVAVADAAGQARFHIPFQEYPSSASLHADGYRGQSGEVVEVEVVTLDAAVDPSCTVDLVKIDVEGFEDKVLLGMDRILAKDRPAIVLEVNADGPAEAIDEILRGHDYRFAHLQAGGAHARERLAADPSEQFRNWLAVPREGGRL